MQYFMGIDVGTTGVKTLLINRQGKVTASSTAEYPLDTPRPGWAEQSPADWWVATQKSICNVIKKSKLTGKDIKGIGLTGQMHGAVFMDKNNKVIHPAILWCDQRTAEECEEITEKAGKEKIHDITSNPVLTGFQAPKIIWLRKNRPEIYNKVTHILLPKDYIRFCLTGEFATDVSDASGTSLFDVKQRKWSKELLKILEIPESFLPQSYESTEITGKISEKVSDTTGLEKETPVVAGGGDQAAGAVGNGIVEEGLVSVSLGTSGVVFAHSEKIMADKKGRLHTFCHAVPGKWHLMGVMLSAGGSFRWLRDTLCREEIKEAEKSATDPYTVMTAKAKTVPAGSEGLLFLPYLSGERCPYPDPNARGVFFGLSLKHSKQHIIRAVMEGVTFGLKDSLEIMNKMGLKSDKIRISGGGGKSNLWCQMISDIFNKKTVRLNSEEGPSYGAAILAGVGIKYYQDVNSACRKLLKETELFKPKEKNVKIYKDAYKLYGNLYPALKKNFDTMAEIV
jgi:xylulokinase